MIWSGNAPLHVEQALAVYELLDGLRESILSRYEDALREECAPSAPPEPSDPSSDRDF